MGHRCMNAVVRKKKKLKHDDATGETSRAFKIISWLFHIHFVPVITLPPSSCLPVAFAQSQSRQFCLHFDILS